MEEKICTYTNDHLARLFDAQMAVLKRAASQAFTLEILNKQKDAVIAKAGEMVFLETHIPFLPVIPASWRSVLDQVVYLHPKKAGFCQILPQHIWNNMEMPKQPYFIFNADDGSALINENPRVHENHLEKNGRRFLTAEEIVALALQDDILLRHWLPAPASSCKVRTPKRPDLEVKGIPFLIYTNNLVLLYCVPADNLNIMSQQFSQGWGLPTCFRESYSGEIKPVQD